MPFGPPKNLQPQRLRFIGTERLTFGRLPAGGAAGARAEGGPAVSSEAAGSECATRRRLRLPLPGGGGGGGEVAGEGAQPPLAAGLLQAGGRCAARADASQGTTQSELRSVGAWTDSTGSCGTTASEGCAAGRAAPHEGGRVVKCASEGAARNAAARATRATNARARAAGASAPAPWPSVGRAPHTSEARSRAPVV